MISDRLWHYLTTPSPKLEGETRRQARLLMAMLVVMLILAAIGGAYGLYDQLKDGLPNEGSLFVIGGVFGSFFLTYLLSRTKYYVWASALFVAAPLIVIAVGAVLSEGKSGTFFLYFMADAASCRLFWRTAE